ncbi:hypothetical protein MRB53_040394 [Persea americana]|nr:hypothetical protein MRB53_040394 [Persea americana]
MEVQEDRVSRDRGVDQGQELESPRRRCYQRCPEFQGTNHYGMPRFHKSHNRPRACEVKLKPCQEIRPHSPYRDDGRPLSRCHLRATASTAVE